MAVYEPGIVVRTVNCLQLKVDWYYAESDDDAKQVFECLADTFKQQHERQGP